MLIRVRSVQEAKNLFPFVENMGVIWEVERQYTHTLHNLQHLLHQLNFARHSVAWLLYCYRSRTTGEYERIYSEAIVTIDTHFVWDHDYLVSAGDHLPRRSYYDGDLQPKLHP